MARWSRLATLVVAATASAAPPVPASGQVFLGPLLDVTERQVGQKTIIQGNRQLEIRGTLGGTDIPDIVVGAEKRVLRPGGRMRWVLRLEDAPIFIEASGCPGFAQLALRFVGRVLAGATTLHGHFQGRSDTGHVKTEGAWTMTDPFGARTTTYSGRIKCKES